ncbi:MAG: hypothetical protein IPP17_08315 [Bacteroidetes bacterium]|nr:hypothetical protein [Bacteroidota bacterium]
MQEEDGWKNQYCRFSHNASVDKVLWMAKIRLNRLAQTTSLRKSIAFIHCVLRRNEDSKNLLGLSSIEFGAKRYIRLKIGKE